MARDGVHNRNEAGILLKHTAENGIETFGAENPAAGKMHRISRAKLAINHFPIFRSIFCRQKTLSLPALNENFFSPSSSRTISEGCTRDNQGCNAPDAALTFDIDFDFSRSKSGQMAPRIVSIVVRHYQISSPLSVYPPFFVLRSFITLSPPWFAF